MSNKKEESLSREDFIAMRNICANNFINKITETYKTYLKENTIEYVIIKNNVYKLEKSIYLEVLDNYKNKSTIPYYKNHDLFSCYNHIQISLIKCIEKDNLTFIKYLIEQPDNIVKMPLYVLNPEPIKKLVNKVNISLNVKVTETYSELYYCNSCGNNKVTVKEKSNRSTDEIQPIEYTCTVCGNRWITG